MNNFIKDSKYLVRRKVIKLLGAAFHVYDSNGSLAFYSKLKAFKLKEDIRLYTGEDMQQEVLVIKARQILDIGATYDVFDSATGEKVGALRRKGLKSIFFKDEWLILDANDQEIGVIKEDSTVLALIRRMIISIIPQRYDCTINGSTVCTFQQNFNPFVRKLAVDFTPDQSNLLDKRVGLAAALLLGAIEGRQQ